jgi:hypothetical protein
MENTVMLTLLAPFTHTWARDEFDRAAWHAASEAIIGLLAQGKPVTMPAVAAWLAVSVEPKDATGEVMARALDLAKRMVEGPIEVAAEAA